MITSEYINPFIDATVSTVEMMCGLKPRRKGDLQLKKWIANDHHIIGVLGVSGGVRGSVLLTLNPDVGTKLVTNFLGEPPEDNSELADGIAELLNILVGAAMADLKNVQLSLPTVIMGNGEEIYTRHSSPWIVIPMTIPDIGDFSIEISTLEAGKENK
ncbi:hypothetical protein BVY04_03855 [bacterium M21]|nr:hypothetical protein BVY04_03855 [bacterium M21]